MADTRSHDIVFDAGIYREIVGTQPGTWYEFKVGWARALRDRHNGQVNQSIDNVIMRQVGADPFGGTEPTSPNVVWGPEFWHGSQGLNSPQMRLTFKAMAERVTIFVRIRNANDSPSDKIFLDVMCLLPRRDIPVETLVPTPTATPSATEPKPTRTRWAIIRPTSVPPTATMILPTPEPARVWTATPLSVAVNMVQSTPEPRRNVPHLKSTPEGFTWNSMFNESAEGGAISLTLLLGIVGGIGIGLLGIILIGGFLVWRIFIHQVDGALDPDKNGSIAEIGGD